MERSVRALKREKEALKALGMDTKEITAKISRKTREYNEFCGMCGINPKPNRLRYESGTADLKKTKAWKAYTNLSFREYRFLKEDGTLADSGDVVDALQVIAELPQSAKVSLDNAVFRLDSSIGNGYNPRTREVFIMRGATKRQI